MIRAILGNRESDSINSSSLRRRAGSGLWMAAEWEHCREKARCCRVFWSGLNHPKILIILEEAVLHASVAADGVWRRYNRCGPSGRVMLSTVTCRQLRHTAASAIKASGPCWAQWSHSSQLRLQGRERESRSGCDVNRWATLLTCD